MRRPLVLLLDDQIEPRESMRELFEVNNCSVIPVSNLDAAIKEITSNRDIDVIVTDINLNSDPRDRSGIAFATIAKQTHPTLPIAAYSAVVSAADIEPEHYHVFSAYLNKLKSSPSDSQKFVGRCIALAQNKQSATEIALRKGIDLDGAQVRAVSDAKAELSLAISQFRSELDNRYIKKPSVAQLVGFMLAFTGLIAAFITIGDFLIGLM